MSASDPRVLEFHARSSAALADFLFDNCRGLEDDLLRLGLRPVPPARIEIDTLPAGADRDSFLAAYRKFDAEYFSFLAACAWCIWHCGLARTFVPVHETCRRVLRFCKNGGGWSENVWVHALNEPTKSALADTAAENLNIYLAILLDATFRSQSPLTMQRVKQSSVRNEAQETVCTFLLNVFSDTTVSKFFEVGSRDGLTSHLWTLLESPTEQLRAAGKSYEARFVSAVRFSLHSAGDSAGFNERNRN